jgi:hypothetical protein
LSEAPLLIGRADVLDHGVAEYNLERLIAKRQLAAVSRDKCKSAFAAFLSPRHVQKRHARPHAGQQPIDGRAADVQDSGLVRYAKTVDKIPHAPRTETAHGAGNYGARGNFLPLGFFDFFH